MAGRPAPGLFPTRSQEPQMQSQRPVWVLGRPRAPLHLASGIMIQHQTRQPPLEHGGQLKNSKAAAASRQPSSRGGRAAAASRAWRGSHSPGCVSLMCSAPTELPMQVHQGSPGPLSGCRCKSCLKYTVGQSTLLPTHQEWLTTAWAGTPLGTLTPSPQFMTGGRHCSKPERETGNFPGPQSGV